jgi:hypothetical protein
LISDKIKWLSVFVSKVRLDFLHLPLPKGSEENQLLPPAGGAGVKQLIFKLLY